MSKPAIPSSRTGKTDVDQALSSIKQTLDDITGQARNATELHPLASTATLPEVITQLNAILARIQ